MVMARKVFGLLLGRRPAKVGGTIAVDGAAGEIVIRRDEWGVPHIDASSESDAWFGLGFCHGQDRGFQLEGLVRVLRGTVAELVGRDGLVIDRLSRRIGFRRSALRQLEALDPDVRANAETYAAGINAGMGPGSPRRPHELTLLRGRSTRWDAADTLAMGKLMAFIMACNWDTELGRLVMLRADGPDAVAALDPAYPEWLPVTWPPASQAGPATDRLAEDLARFLSFTGAGGGSNNWVADGSRTATGRPLLANDPHLGASAPPHFYLAHLRCPQWEAAGASLVGTFGIFAGHNDAAAWGVTNGMVDNTDLCIEEISPGGGTVRRGGTFVPCQVAEETIQVKGSHPVTERVLLTPEGPVIGPALDGEPGAISMRATWLETRPFRGLVELVKLRSPEDFHTRLADHPSASMNVVFATIDGHIGWQLVGEPPVRRAGFGAFPMSGADPEAGWDRTLPFSEMPRGLDPDCGWIATANGKPAVGDDGPFLSADFCAGYRTARIGERLAERRDWDVAGMAGLQLDVVSLLWREAREAILAARPATAVGAEALRLLASWDGELSPDSSGGALFELLTVEIARRAAAAKAPNSVEASLGKGFTPLVPVGGLSYSRGGLVTRLLREQPAGWLDRPWPEAIGEALDKVAERLHERFGHDPARWGWGRIRLLRFPHPAGSRRPLDRVFNLGPVPGFGDTDTVAQAHVHFTDATASAPVVPALRMVIDVGRWDRCRWALPGGQSGNPCSPHYDDQLPLWQRAHGIAIPWTEAEVKAATRSTLQLQQAQTREHRLGI